MHVSSHERDSGLWWWPADRMFEIAICGARPGSTLLAGGIQEVE
jgi:hypothetical protein